MKTRMVSVVVTTSLMFGLGAGAASATSSGGEAKVQVTSSQVQASSGRQVSPGVSNVGTTGASVNISPVVANGQYGVAVAPWVRIAIKVALQVLKKTSKSTYNAIYRYVALGKSAFIKWWNTSVPRWVKDIFGGVSAAAIYDTVKWLLGL